MSDKLLVHLFSNKIEIIPGHKTEIKAIIKNTSDVTEHYSVIVEGIDPRWVTISPESVSLSPGDESELSFIIQYPLSNSGEAKKYTADLKFTSIKDSTVKAIFPIEICVGSSFDYDLQLIPEKQRGRRGSFTVSITNKDDKPVTYKLEGQDPYNACRFQFKRQSVDIKPGETTKIPLSVEPKDKPFRGSVEIYKFKVIVTPHGGLIYQSKRVSGELTYKPILRAVPALILILIAIIVVNIINVTSPFTGNLAKGDLPITYTLNMNMYGNGAIIGYGSHEEGDLVSVSAIAAPGWEFVEWTGDIDTVSDHLLSTTTIVMEKDYNITANFKLTKENPYYIYNILFNPQFTSDPLAAVVKDFSQWVTIEFDFAIDFDFKNTTGSDVDIMTEVYIVALPFSNGTLAPACEVRGCYLLWPQDKKGEIGFSIYSARRWIIIDHVKFQVKSADKRTILHEFFNPVNYRFGQDL